MKTTYQQCKQIRIFWALANIDQERYKRPHKSILSVFPEVDFERFELEFILSYLDIFYVFDIEELVDGISELDYTLLYQTVSKMWDELEGVSWPEQVTLRLEKMQELIHMSPAFEFLNAFDVTEPHINALVLHIKKNAVQRFLPKVMFDSGSDLLTFMELAHFSCSVGVTWCHGPIRSSHSMYLEHDQPEYIFDSVLDDLPDDLEQIDDHYENTKMLKSKWLAEYEESYWELDDVVGLLSCAEPL